MSVLRFAAFVYCVALGAALTVRALINLATVSNFTAVLTARDALIGLFLVTMLVIFRMLRDPRTS